MKMVLAHRRLGAALLVAVALVVAGSLAFSAPALLASPAITLRIADAATGLADAEGEPGAGVTMRVSIAQAEPMAGVQFQVRFDPSVVQVAEGGVAEIDVPEGFLFDSAVNNSEGFVNMILVGPQGAGVSEVSIADITFTLTGSPGQSTTLALVDALAGDASSEPLAVTPVNGSIAIRSSGNVAAAPGGATAAPTPTLVPTLTPLPASPEAQPSPTPAPGGGTSCAGPVAGSAAGGLAGAGDFLLVGGVLGGAYLLSRRRRG